MLSSEHLTVNNKFMTYNSESKPNVPKFNGVPSATNRATDRLKNQHHEELRRRARYVFVIFDFYFAK